MTTQMKLRELETHLQKVEGFNEPKILLEQYPTRPHIAACMLHTIQSVYGDIENCMVCDLGSGCGMLTIGSVMLGAGYVLSIECDQDAIEKCQENLDMFDLDNVDIVQDDVTNMKTSTKFDTVVMNPPFGCRTKGIDTMFVQQGLKMANVVYSLHKTSVRYVPRVSVRANLLSILPIFSEEVMD